MFWKIKSFILKFLFKPAKVQTTVSSTNKKICGQPIRVVDACEQYIGQEGWVFESWDGVCVIILPNSKSLGFFNYQLEFLPLLEIDKVRILTFYLMLLDQCFGGNDDETICKATGLDSSDLDKYYSLAESICSQTKDMPNDGTIESVLVNADKIVSFKFKQ